MQRDLFYKMEMFNGTLLVLFKYESVWEARIVFKEEVDRLTEGLGEINDFLLYNDNTLSATAAKNQALELMVNSTEIICEAGIVHASKTKDNELMATFNLSYSDLKEGKEIEIYKRCMNIGASAIPVEAQLIAIGMPATQLADQSNNCLKFRPMIGSARRVRKGGKSNKEEMLVVYAEMDMIYGERVDNMMGLLKAANSKFFTEYTNSRVIGYWKKKHETPDPPAE